MKLFGILFFMLLSVQSVWATNLIKCGAATRDQVTNEIKSHGEFIFDLDRPWESTSPTIATLSNAKLSYYKTKFFDAEDPNTYDFGISLRLPGNHTWDADISAGTTIYNYSPDSSLFLAATGDINGSIVQIWCSNIFFRKK